VNALLLAREVVVPVTMDALALVGARQTANGLEELSQLWPERSPRLRAVVPTMVRERTRAAQAARAALVADARLGPALVWPGIAQDLALTYASAAHATIWEYAPRSQAAKDYDRLASQWLGKTEDRHHGQERNQSTAAAGAADAPPIGAVVCCAAGG